jgi:hypothetical protein
LKTPATGVSPIVIPWYSPSSIGQMVLPQPKIAE